MNNKKTMLSEGHNRVLETSSVVNVLGQQSGTKTVTEVKAKATKCRSQLPTVMCHKMTMVNIAIVHVTVYFYITFFPVHYSRQYPF